jgi:hypothetical protein
MPFCFEAVQPLSVRRPRGIDRVWQLSENAGGFWPGCAHFRFGAIRSTFDDSTGFFDSSVLPPQSSRLVTADGIEVAAIFLRLRAGCLFPVRRFR